MRAFAAFGVALALAPGIGWADVQVVGAGPAVTLSTADLVAMPATRVAVPATAHDPARVFEGPSLWSVLAKAGAIDPADSKTHVRSYVVAEGDDGYTALIALGEMAPGFEGKDVILAERMDGQPLDPAHWRVVVPGDGRGGRGVHDVVRLTVGALPDGKR